MCPILLQLPTWSGRLVRLSRSRAAQGIVTYQVNFSSFFQYSSLLLELKIAFVIKTWLVGSFQLSHQTGCLTRACKLKKIYTKNRFSEWYWCERCCHDSRALILSGTPNPQATRTIVSTQKALCSWVFTGAMKIDHKCYLNGVVRIGAVQSSCLSKPRPPSKSKSKALQPTRPSFTLLHSSAALVGHLERSCTPFTVGDDHEEFDKNEGKLMNNL